MSRQVPIDPRRACQMCGAKPAWDFMGDVLCADCVGEIAGDDSYDDDWDE